MDEAREPLLMLAVAVAVAAYRAIKYVQDGEVGVKAENIELRAKNESLLAVVKKQARQINILNDYLADPEPEELPPRKSIWDNENPLW